MSNTLAWVTANWLIVTWCAVLIGLAILLAIFGWRWWREVEGDPSEVARFDAYLDDVEDGYIDLPGPEQGWQGESPGGPRPGAGEYHPAPPPPPWVGELHPYETAFPAMLQLGQPGDGTDKMYTRMDVYRMTVRNAVEAARRELAAECGIRYVPMELVAA